MDVEPIGCHRKQWRLPLERRSRQLGPKDIGTVYAVMLQAGDSNLVLLTETRRPVTGLPCGGHFFARIQESWRKGSGWGSGRGPVLCGV